eukprot:2098276-Amphidinium_carterae.1
MDVSSISVSRNQIAGALPESGLKRMPLLERCHVDNSLEHQQVYSPNTNDCTVVGHIFLSGSFTNLAVSSGHHGFELRYDMLLPSQNICRHKIALSIAITANQCTNALAESQ